MKAIALNEFGGPEVLRLVDVDVPQPGPGEVLIEVHAVSVNRTLDCEVRAGTYAQRPVLPHILGCDASGIVRSVGEGVDDRAPGNAVVTSPVLGVDNRNQVILKGVTVQGGCAEYMTIPARLTHLLPDGIEFGAATVLARHAPVAYTQLIDRAKLMPGEWVLVMGAAGGLGSAGVQAAKSLGARVIAAAGADDRVKAACDLGADFGVNYRTTDLSARVFEITGGRGANVVLENIGDPELFPKALHAMGRDGRMVTAGAHGGGQVTLDVKYLYQRQLSIIGAPVENPAHYQTAFRAYLEGRFRVNIDRRYPLSRSVEAHEYVESGNAIGKVIIEPQADARRL